MAYTTPPTFADNNILTAAQLNILSNDIEYLYGLGDVLNVPFSAKLYDGNATLQDQIRWKIRKRYRYLHYSLRLLTGSIDPDMILYYGTNTLLRQTSPSLLTAPHTFAGYIDLNSFSLTTGNWYDIYWDGVTNGGLSAICDYLIEASGTTL